MIHCRLKEKTNQHLKRSNVDFGRAEAVQTTFFSLQILMERAWQFHTPVYMCFVDLKKAYDTVNHIICFHVNRDCASLWKCLGNSQFIVSAMETYLQ